MCVSNLYMIFGCFIKSCRDIRHNRNIKYIVRAGHVKQQQQALVQAIQQLDLDQVQSLLADGLLTRTLLIQNMVSPVSIFVMVYLSGGKML